MSATVLISGAGVAGPALAHWLTRYGFRPTVVELAPQLRRGGQAVDFRGETHRTVLDRMGVVPALHAHRTGGSPMVFLDARGRERLRLPGDFAGGELEVPRGDLVRVLHRDSADRGAEYLFGDTLTALEEDADGVLARFRHGPPRRFDLVVGADGLHSKVRALAFGPEERYVTHLGYYAAAFTLPGNPLGLTEGSVGLNVPGRLAAVGADHRDPDRSGAFLVFASPRLDLDRRDTAAHKALLARTFADLGWQVPGILAALPAADDLYFDAIARSAVPRWSHGRIALLGDAACGATIGGMGTGAAVVGAYVLAGELAAAGGDHTAGFAAYEAALRPYAERCQGNGDRTGHFLAPATATGLRLRNALLSRRPLLSLMMKAGESIASLPLRDYAHLEVAGPAAPRPAVPS